MSRNVSALFSGKSARLFVLVLLELVLISSRFRDNFPVSYDELL